MPGNKYIANNAGTFTEVVALQSSAGVADAGKIPALDAAGRLDQTMMPAGVAADTYSVLASEALAAGDLVNIYNNANTANCRKADASSTGKEAMGFVLTAVAAAATATIYFEGNNTAVSGLTPGKQWLSATTPGKSASSAPTAAGSIVQSVGFSASATELNFQHSNPIVLA